jgi:ribosome-associated heat shock protein Hsp15
MSSEKVRVDRWLWSVRAYKTRTLSTDACKRKWVTVNGTDAKPSREIKTQDIVTFKVGPLEKKVQVLQILEKRISAKLVDQFLKDLTPQSSYQEAEVKKRAIISSPFGKRARKGRPSKKERREMEDFFFNHED